MGKEPGFENSSAIATAEMIIRAVAAMLTDGLIVLSVAEIIRAI